MKEALWFVNIEQRVDYNERVGELWKGERKNELLFAGKKNLC